MIRLQNAFLAQEIIDIKDQVNFRDGQKLKTEKHQFFLDYIFIVDGET